MANLSEITEVMDLLATAFNEKLDSKKILLYAKTLDDIDGDQLEAAAVRYIKQGGKWFPKVFELRQMAEIIQATPAPDEHKTMYWNAMSAFWTPEAYTDRRYSRYFTAPGRYEDLGEDARDWWESLAIETQDEMEATR